MTIRYLGTAAAEGLPAVFCNCPACLNARRRGGRNVRTRSQVLVNDDFLIDFPMDTYLHALRFRLDLSAVRHVFITHSHMDHCYPQDLIMHGRAVRARHDFAGASRYTATPTCWRYSKSRRRGELKSAVRASICLTD